MAKAKPRLKELSVLDNLKQSVFSKSGYFYSTRTMAYGFFAVLPLLVTYEVFALAVNRDHMFQIRNAADVFLKNVIYLFGIHGPFALAMIVVIVFFLSIFLREEKTAPLRVNYLIFMIIESTLLATLLIVGLNFVLRQLMLSAAALTTGVQVMLALGAGVYEELVFRTFLFYLTGITLFKVLRLAKTDSFIFAALFSSILFSWMHYMGGEVFTFYSFFYRIFAGLFFCGLYLLRGLGVAAWTHTIYDFFVIFLWQPNN
ncbi:CPBP family intramembrane metalloprotease [candidate division KSB1 bacterium]|nr:CPBP family intramembrane metalloprotease [candidate division KSB1 bacterium]